MDLAATLKRVPLFRGLGDAELAPFCRRCHVRTLPAGAFVFGEGDPGEALYIVVSGSVKVFVSANGGREVILAIERAGSYFGELSMIDGRPRSASVVTTKPTRLLTITRTAFRQCLSQRPDVAFRIIATTVDRIRRLTDIVRDLATGNVRRRTVNALIRLAEPIDAGWLIRARPSQQDIADMIGASREMAGRVLRALAAEGHVRYAGSHVVIHHSIVDAESPVRADS